MRGRVLVAVVTAVMSLAMTQAAWAVGGNVSIRFNPATERFHGRVGSPEAECRIARVVKVFKITADGRELQGMARTSDAGVWRMFVMASNGNYVAIAPKYEAMQATCDRLVSETLDVM